MAKPVVPSHALLFCGILFSEGRNYKDIFRILEKKYGQIILVSQIFDFKETDYYKPEMGDKIKRVYLGFNNLIPMEQIKVIKLDTNRMEIELFSEFRKRRVNIDPGYITNSKVVLATTKNQQHRIYLGDGIFAEVTLRYHKGSFIPWEWTYRDYRREESILFFNHLREIYRKKLKKTSG